MVSCYCPRHGPLGDALYCKTLVCVCFVALARGAQERRGRDAGVEVRQRQDVILWGGWGGGPSSSRPNTRAHEESTTGGWTLTDGG